jgi:Ala-tRNA(Pro) deacylase
MSRLVMTFEIEYTMLMHATPDILFKRLKDLHITIQNHNHSPVFTVEEAKIYCSHLPGCHCKNLFLKDKKGKLLLIVTPDTRVIDLKFLRRQIGSYPLSFGKPELLGEVLGVEPGSVSPFALINDTQGQVQVVLDEEMMDMDLLNYHPLTNVMTTAITPTDLLIFIRATYHNPVVVNL